MHIKIASANSVIIYFGNSVCKEVSYKVKAAYKHLRSLDNLGFIELIPSYTSLFVSYDIFKFDFESIKSYLQTNLKNLKSYEEDNNKIIQIDVYYGLEVGLDLQKVAKFTNLSLEEVIHIHSSKVYDVYAIGFLPGFAYLGTTDKRITTPRLVTPRKITPKGSVSIADNQTAVYPKDSPGGWNILGKTAFEFFDKRLEGLSSINIDSRIKFNAISREEFLSVGGKL